MRKGSLILLGIAIGGLVFVFAGCEQTPPPPPPTKVEKTEPPPPKETPEAESQEEAEAEPTPPGYEYDPSGRREPFKSLVKDEVVDAIEVIATPDPELLKTPLQKFDVNQLKVTGIILGSLGDYARVIAPDGKSYTINVGTLVGMHQGEVISITENIVVVKEIIRYESGKVDEVETPLYLNPIDEEERS